MALSKGLKMNTLLKICTRKYGFTVIRRDYGPEAVEKLRGSLICNVSVNVNVIWCETGKPNLDEAHMFADGIHSMFPGKPLVYNFSPSFNWKANLSDKEIAEFQKELGKISYRHQFIT